MENKSRGIVSKISLKLFWFLFCHFYLGCVCVCVCVYEIQGKCQPKFMLNAYYFVSCE